MTTTGATTLDTPERQQATPPADVAARSIPPRSSGEPLRGSPPAAPRHDRPRRWQWWAPTGRQLIVAAIALLAAALYTWGLARNGTANSYYAAAVRSGAKSWKAFFFGSLDPGSFITVDKPPAALWVMELSARLFGFSSWSMLLPEAAAGVGSVLILHRLVRRWAGDLSAHLAALALALTPVAVLMFRYNNPDALLTLVGLAAVWALWTGLETGRTRFLVLAGALVGLGFETKMLQALLIVPAMAVVYLWAGRPRLGRRVAQLAAAGVAMIVAGGWWVAAVALWPVSARPYIGSTSNNSILSLVFGYNGFARILGNSGGGPGGGGAGFGGTPGWLRLFNTEIGGQVTWLVPLAAAGLVAGLWLTRRAPRTDRGRAGWVLWGGWAAVCAAVLSLSRGIFHPYYTVQLAPAIAALAGAGGVALWHLGRRHGWLAWTLPAAVLATAAVAVGLLDRTPNYHPWLRPGIVVGAALAGIGLLIAAWSRHKLWTSLAAGLAAVTLLAGPGAYALTTISRANNGSTAAAGPTATAGAGGGPGGGGLAAPGGSPAAAGAARPSGAAGGSPATTGAPPSAGGGGGAGTASRALISYLESHRDGAEYLVATFGSQSSAPIIIASGEPVITIGGFTGSDPAPTLAQFERLVAEGRVRFVLIQGSGAGGGRGGASSAITTWVTTHGTQVAAGNYGNDTSAGTLYQLSSG
jgi:4-amino-4-deoxy-L-arabinose transferase-like glycosyltransferase